MSRRAWITASVTLLALVALVAEWALLAGRTAPPAPAGIVDPAPVPAASHPAEAPAGSDRGEAAPATDRPEASALADGDADAEAPAPVPLERLLRVPAPDPSAQPGLAVDRNPHLREPGVGTPADGPSLRDHVRVDRSTERAGIPGPRETTTDRTDASVRLPVQESVDLRGGVRVDSRRHGEGGREELETTPNVGIDVRF